MAHDQSMFLDGSRSDGGEAGLYWYDFINALQMWVVLQERPPTVTEASITFNLQPTVITRAVEDGYWMFLSGTGLSATIEVDGE